MNTDSLDQDYLNDNEEQDIHRHWSILVLVGVGLKAFYFLSFFMKGIEIAPEVFPFSEALFTLIQVYLIWFIQLMCTQSFKVRSVHLPALVVMVLSIIRGAYFVFTSLSSEVEDLRPYWKFSVGFNLCIIFCMVWLIVMVFRLPSHPYQKYMRYWATAVSLKTGLGLLLPMIGYFLRSVDMAWKDPINNVLWLLPDLVLVYMVLKESQFGIVGNKRTSNT